MSKQTNWPRAGYLWWLGLASLAFFGVRTLSNASFWIHLATGRLLAEQGWVRADPFSFTTDPTRIWVNPSWLYDAVLYRLWQVGGSYGVTLVFVACIVTAFSPLRSLLRDRASDANQALALLLVAWLIAPAMSVGPHGIGLLMTAIFICMLAKGRPRHVLFALLPLQAIWTNMHASFLIGPLLAALFVYERRNELYSRLPKWLPIALLAATLLNPYGFRLHHLAVSGVLNPDAGVLLEWISPFHSEFAPFGSHIIQWLALLAIASGFVSIAGKLPTGLTSIGVVGAFLLVLSPRYLSFAGLFVFPFIAMSLSGVGMWVTRRIGSTIWAPAGRSFIACGAAATLLLVSSGYYYNRLGSGSEFGLGIAHDMFPQRACERILSRPDFPERMINLAQDGGYLAWALPNRKIFVDTRGPVYGLAFYQALGRALLSDSDQLAKLLDRFDPGAIVLPCTWPGTGQATRRLVDSGDWAPAYFDGTTMVLLRNTRSNARLLTDFEMHRAGLKEIESARRAYQREIDSVFPARNQPRLIGAATIYFSLWRFLEARTVLELVTQGSPTHLSALQQLGISYFNLGQYNQAARALERVIRHRSRDAVPHLWLSRAYLALGDSRRAERMQQTARRLNPSIAGSFEKEFPAHGAPRPAE